MKTLWVIKTDGIIHVNPPCPPKLTLTQVVNSTRFQILWRHVLNLKAVKLKLETFTLFPTLAVYQMSVSEDKVPGEEVGRLMAKDPDLGDNGHVNYRFVDGDGMAVFELSTDSETKEAIIKLKKVRNKRFVKLFQQKTTRLI